MSTTIMDKKKGQIILMILFSVLALGQYSRAQNVVVKNNLLCYTYLNDSLSYHIQKDWDKVIFTGNVMNKKVLLKNPEYQIKGELFNFLCNLKIVNGWPYQEDYSGPVSDITYNDYVTAIKKSLQLFYVGQLKISKSFDSYLIFVPSRRDNLDSTSQALVSEMPLSSGAGRVLLMNVRQGKMVTITEMGIYEYRHGEYGEIIHTVKRGSIFIQKAHSTFDKVKLKFTYDEDGMLHVLKSVRKYKNGY